VPAAADFATKLKNAKNAKSGDQVPGALLDIVIADAVLVDFKEYLKSRNIEFTDDDIRNSVDFIKRRIMQEVYTSSFGLEEGYKIGIQGDAQVLKALEALPEAISLMTSGQTKPAL
jgi:hypothetical protein